MTRRTELACLWSIAVGLALFSAGWLISHYFPPPSPNLSPVEIKQFYLDHADGMRLGFSLMAFGGVLFAPYAGAITSVMRRIEGPGGPLAYTQLAFGTLATAMMFVPLFPFAAAAFRPDTSPELIRMLNDQFWTVYVMAVWPLVGQVLTIAVLALRDSASNPLPRWFGYLSVFAAFDMVFTATLIFFKSGAFSSVGIMALWVPAVITYAYYMSALFVFHRAITAPPARHRSVVHTAAEAPQRSDRVDALA